MSAPKKQAPRLARPAIRYWKGKAPKGAADVNESDSEAEEEVPSDREGGWVTKIVFRGLLCDGVKQEM